MTDGAVRLDRVVLGRAAKIRATFTNLDGEPVDPDEDSAVATVTRDDGTVLFVGRPADPEDAEGVVSVKLTAAELDRLDLLHVVWAGTVDDEDQTARTLVDVAGGYLFEIADARADTTLSDSTEYPTDQIAKARAIAEDVLEQACGYAFVPRYRRERGRLMHGGRLRLAERIGSVRSITVDGVLLTGDELAAVTIKDLFTLAGLPGTGTVYEVVYECGRVAPPPGAGRVALKIAKRYLVKTPIDERASTMTTDDGVITLVTPGVRGMLFDIPEANAFVQQNRAGTLAGIF
jgi:hypothetical protein